MDREEVVAIVEVAYVLQHGDNREFRVLDRGTEDPEVIKADVGAHSVGDVGAFFRSLSLGRRFAGADDSGDVRAVAAGGVSLWVQFHELLPQVPTGCLSPLFVPSPIPSAA